MTWVARAANVRAPNTDAAGRLSTWLAIARDLVLMTLGGYGMLREITADKMDMSRAALFLAMIAGSGALNALWLLRNTPTAGQPSSPQSPSSQ